VPATRFSEPQDARLVEMWLDGRPETTKRAYAAALRQYVDSTPKPLREQGLADLQAFAASLHGSPAYRARQLAAIASLWAFGFKIGYLPYNAAAALRRPAVVGDRGTRILTVAQVNQIVYGEPDARDRALLRTLYVAAPRVSELAALRRCDVQTGDAGEYLRFVGKGDKERYVRIPTSLYRDLILLGSRRYDGSAPPAEAPIFFSRNLDRAISPRRVDEIVRDAGARVGVEISPHWLRHAHASHALDHGCPLHVLQATLGHASIRTTGIYAHARPSDSSSLYLEGRG